ncbi:uncharacterized protein LOC134869364 isoform X2 [Eleginops maclovinus]|uniref:uncharacterized protein LOC134869364 isoform X2 n=1 Tax=Eleginops maclovinus TaxID=56733 RepID=UPI0030805668
MMETKVWIALCALLLINLGSAEHDEVNAPASSSSQSSLPDELSPKAADSVLHDPSREQIHLSTPAPPLRGSDTNSSSQTNGSLIVNATTEDETMANGTNITASSEAAVPESNGNQTFLMTSQPQTPPPESHAPASHTPNTSNNTTTTTTSPIHTTHSTSVVTLTTAPLTTHHSAPTLHDSVTPSNHSTSAPTPEPPKPESSTTTIITNSISMPITSSSHETPNSESTAHTSPQTTSQASKAHLEKTSNPPSSPTAKAESLADLSSKLNAGDVTQARPLHTQKQTQPPSTSSASTDTTKHSTIIALFGKETEAVMGLCFLSFSVTLCLSAK